MSYHQESAIPADGMTSILRLGRLDTFGRFLLWIYLFSFAFDFRGEEGGSTIQFVYAGLSLITGLGFVLYESTRYKLETITVNMVWIVWLWWLYLLSTVVTAVLVGVVWGHYIRVVFPVILTGVSMLIVYVLARRKMNLNEVVIPLLYAALVSVYFRAIYAVWIADIDIEEMRYQIASPATWFILAYVTSAIVERRRIGLVAWIATIGTVTFVLLSITRTFLLQIAVLMLGFFLVTHRNGLRENLRRMNIAFVVFICAVLPAVALGWFLRPDIFETWTSRLFYHSIEPGADITLVTRLAEWSGMWQSFTSSAISIAFGKGLGSVHEWDPNYYQILASVVPAISEMGSIEIWYRGHSMWVYSFYSGGLMFGWIVPSILLWALYSSYQVAKVAICTGATFQSRVITLPYFVLLLCLGYSFAADPFSERFQGLLLGLMFCMPAWVKSLPVGVMDTRFHRRTKYDQKV